MGQGSSALVRSVTEDRYIHPAIAQGQFRFSIAVRDVMKDLQGTGFPSGNYHQICTAIRTKKFLRDNAVEIERIDGPPKGSGPTVVVHYRRIGTVGSSALSTNHGKGDATETPAERAKRLVDGLRGLLKEELAQFGGAEGFIRWVRSDDEEERLAIEAGSKR